MDFFSQKLFIEITNMLCSNVKIRVIAVEKSRFNFKSKLV